MDNERLAAFEAWEGNRPDGLYWPAFAAGWNAAARATAHREDDHCCPVSQAGYTAGVVAEVLDAWLGMPSGYPPLDRALCDWREARDAAREAAHADGEAAP